MQHDSSSSSCAMEAAGLLADATMLQTPQRSAPPPSPYSRAQDSPGGGGGGGGGEQEELDPHLSMTVEERLEALRQELTMNFEAQLSSQANELREKFESQLAEVRRELTSEYEARLEESEARLEEQREKCAGLQEDLDQLLLCLGQEGRKVESLEEAMRQAGLDPQPVTQPIDDEYAAMEN